MKHVGDITKIDGRMIEAVDVIVGGSPCQDLSVAGKRAGLAGERSGLFMEQIRIIKEMRENGKRTISNDNIRPRFMAWENVPGAFSSNNGEDFRAVLEETAKIADENAVIPRPPKGKWMPAGCIMGNGWSIAWRVHDAQFWGVPQRRRRIALVADFGGECAPEILFERESLSGNTEESRKKRQKTAGDAGTCIEETGGAIGFHLTQDPVSSNELSYACSCGNSKSGQCVNGVVYGIGSYDSNAMKSDNPHSRMGTGGGNVPMVMETYQKTTGALMASGYDKLGTQEAANDMYVVQSTMAMQAIGEYKESECALALKQRDYKDSTDLVCSFYPQMKAESQCFRDDNISNTLVNGTNPGYQNGICYGLDRAAYNQGQNAQYNFAVDEEKVGYQVAKGPGAVCTKGDNNAETRNQILRLLQETYGAETIFKWGVAVLDALQQANVLQQGVHESGISGEAENRQELDGGSPPCPSVVAGWLLRDMRQREECGCPPQGRKSSEQRFEQFDESMPELSQQNSQACKDLFDMWEKGEGLWLLREALSEIQKIRQSIDGQRQSVYGCAIVRRLTPLEAERLQAFPDHWTDIGEWTDSKGKKHKDADSPRYKALGNSIALPFWEWMAKRMAVFIDTEHPTIGSLFDGISGFCLAFAKAGVRPVFSSEIEEFPIAVAKKHFGDDDTGEVGDYEQYL